MDARRSAAASARRVYGCGKKHDVEVELTEFPGAKELEAAGWGFIFSEGGWLCPEHYRAARASYERRHYVETLKAALEAQAQYYGGEDEARDAVDIGHVDNLRDLIEMELGRIGE